MRTDSPIPYSTAFKSFAFLSSVLSARALSMIVQVVGKRIILAKESEHLSATFSDYSGFENAIYTFVFASQSILSVLVSHANAEPGRDPTILGFVFRRGLVFSAIFTGIAGAACLIAPLVFRVMQQPKQIVEGSQAFFAISFAAYLFDFLYRCYANFLIGLSLSVPALAGDVCQGALDLFFTYVFVMGGFGCAKMGVNGAVLAYVIAAATSCLGISLYFRFVKKELRDYHLFSFSEGFSWAETKKMIGNGFPVGLSNTIEFAAQMLVTFYCGLSGDAALMGIQAAASYSIFVTYITEAIGEAASVKIGEYKDNPALARFIGTINIAVCFSLSSLSALFLFLFSEPYANLFVSSSDAPDDHKIVIQFSRIQAGIEIFNALRAAFTMNLMGSLDTRAPSIINIACVFFLNVLLATIAQFGMHEKPVIMYGTQAIGYMAATLGVGALWFAPKQVTSAARCLFPCFFRSENYEVVPTDDLDDDESQKNAHATAYA